MRQTNETQEGLEDEVYEGEKIPFYFWWSLISAIVAIIALVVSIIAN